MEAFDVAISDEELVRQAKNGDAFSKIISRYKKIAEIKARKLGGDRSEAEISDLTDEGIIAVFYAVKTFDESRGVLFSTYADACITNRIKTVVEKQNRIRSKESDEVMHGEMIDFENPENILIERERFDEVMKRVSKKLSGMELSVFQMYLHTESYKIISEKLSISEKAVDNAMQRVRKKLRSVLSSGQ